MTETVAETTASSGKENAIEVGAKPSGTKEPGIAAETTAAETAVETAAETTAETAAAETTTAETTAAVEIIIDPNPGGAAVVTGPGQ